MSESGWSVQAMGRHGFFIIAWLSQFRPMGKARYAIEQAERRTGDDQTGATRADERE